MNTNNEKNIFEAAQESIDNIKLSLSFITGNLGDFQRKLDGFRAEIAKYEEAVAEMQAQMNDPENAIAFLAGVTKGLLESLTKVEEEVRQLKDRERMETTQRIEVRDPGPIVPPHETEAPKRITKERWPQELTPAAREREFKRELERVRESTRERAEAVIYEAAKEISSELMSKLMGIHQGGNNG